jgi:hypothetical protein
MTTIAEQVINITNSFAIELLYNKLEVLEEQFDDSIISYMDYSSSKDDILNDIHSILSTYLCPIDLTL